MANATGITLNPFSFEGTARQTILDNQSLDKTTPFTLHGRVYFEPTDADMNLAAVSSNEGLVTISAITYHAGDQLNPPYYDVVAKVNQNASGVSEITLTESNTSWQDSHNISYQFSGTPRMAFNPSSQTLASGVSVPFVDVPAHYYEDASGMTLAEIVATACSKIDDGDTIPSYVANQSDNWSGLTNNTPRFFLNSGTTVLVANNFYENDSTKDRRLRAWFSLQDTSGNTYITDYTLYQEGSGSTPSPSNPDIQFHDTASTVVATSIATELQLDVTDCTPEPDDCEILSVVGDLNITGLSIYNGRYGWICNLRLDGTNSTANARTSDVTVRFYDTSGNTYDDTIHVTQTAGTWAALSPSSYTVDDQAHTLCSEVQVVNGTLSSLGVISQVVYPSGTAPTPTISGNQVCVDIPANSSDNELTYNYTFSATCASSSGGSVNPYFTWSIRQSAYTPLDSYIKFADTGKTVAGTVTSVNCELDASGCTIDGSQVDLVSSSGDLSGIYITPLIYEPWLRQLQIGWYGTNTTPNNKTSVVTVRFYDTSGNTYEDSIQITQLAVTFMELVPANAFGIQSGGQQTCTELQITNGTLTDLVIGSAWTQYNDGRADGQAPTPTITGNQICVNIPQSDSVCAITYNYTVLASATSTIDGTVVNFNGNYVAQQLRAALDMGVSPAQIYASSAETSGYTTVTGFNETFESFTYTTAQTEGNQEILILNSLVRDGDQLKFYFDQNPSDGMRGLRIIFDLVSESGNHYERTCTIYQDPATGPKNISTNLNDVNVASGNSSTSGIISTIDCEYDHLTYMTGGSIPLTVTTDGNKLIVNTPENNTNYSRVGYAYITFYDEDGNQYYQSVTIRQAKGTGPGPQPDPDTGYVYTSFTITDNEQHRFFHEAMPGVTYSAAGQYYKTVLACEARYSLYYVNSYGGVDVLPFKEKSWKKNDTITRFNYSRSFRNNTLEFENVNYMNEIKPSWELHTGWMSDESSQRMHELVESTIVYLYDALEKEYTPVVMTDKKLEYKTYHNQGKKFYNYTVNVEESQSKERR